MYVVIPVADEPRNPSLLMALDSIRKYTDYVPVTVGKNFGLCEHINTVQGDNAFANTDLAMRVAIEEIGEPFVFSADDIFWTRRAEPVRWAIGDLLDAVGSHVYANRKRDTARFLDSLGLPTWDYEAHVPMLVEPDPMLEILNIIETNPTLEKRSLYGNMTGVPDVVAPDVKLRKRNDPVPNAPWVSTYANPSVYKNLSC